MTAHEQPTPPTPLHKRIAVDAKGAAELLGVSDRWLEALTRTGEVPVVRRGGRVLYPVQALRKWANENAVAQAAPTKEGE